MKDIFHLLITGLYVKLRGKSHTKTDLTDNAFTYRYETKTKDNSIITVLLFCQQFEHIQTFKRWLFNKKKVYTYKVQILLLNGDDNKKHSLPVMYYPLLCSRLMLGTTYPHYCAINAYIDDILSQELDSVSVM